MKVSQKQLVLETLKKTGQVSRNGMLANSITRLGAIICDIKQDGYDIKGAWNSTASGRDYVYYMDITPKNEKEARELAELQGRRKLEKVWNGMEWVMKEIVVPIV